MIKIKFIKDTEKFKKGEFAEASKKSAESAVNNGYAEYIEEKETKKDKIFNDFDEAKEFLDSQDKNILILKFENNNETKRLIFFKEKTSVKELNEFQEKNKDLMTQDIYSHLEKNPKNKKRTELLLDGNGRSISDLSRDVSNILQDKNVLFYRPNSQQIVEVGKIKLHNTKKDFYTGFRNIKDKRLITLIEKYAEVGYWRKTRQGEIFEVKSLSPNKSDIILCSEILEQALPQIERIFSIPIPIMYDGKLSFAKKGFDARFSSWTPYDSPKIENEKMDIKEAKEIIDNLFSEFCFLSEQDKANAIAGLLTPFLRGLYEDFNTRTPIFFYLGNRERVGKDYCAGITGLVYDGQCIDENPISSGDRSSNNNEELRKKITSALISGRKRLHFANNKGYINNAILEQVSTSKIYSDRLLGRNEIVNLPNEIDFSLSGNVGVTYTPDFANRCRFVNLFLDIEDANSREFKNPLLHEWVIKNRGLILSAMFSLVRNWIDKGMKKGSVPFASFPNWASVCGGIMESAGYSNPCMIDKNNISLAGDSETSDMKELFEICFEHYPNKAIKKKDIINLIQEENLFPYLDFEKRNDQTNFALKLRKFIGRVLSGIKLTIADINVRTARQDYLFKKDILIGGNVGNVGNISPMSDYSDNFYNIRGKTLTKVTKVTTKIPNLLCQDKKDMTKKNYISNNPEKISKAKKEEIQELFKDYGQIDFQDYEISEADKRANKEMEEMEKIDGGKSYPSL